MAGYESSHSLWLEPKPHDPEFPQKAALSNYQIRCELMETIAATREAIASSKAVLAEADRVVGKS